MPRAGASDVLSRVLAPVVEAIGLDLEALEITPAGRRRVVRVVVDGDTGVSLDQVADVSRLVSGVLDGDAEAERALGGSPYVLEVSSPGVDRPLTEPRHWRRAVGRLVVVALKNGTEARGRLVSAVPDRVVLSTDGGERTIPLADIARGRVEVEFRRESAAASDTDDNSDVDVDGEA